MPQRVCGGQRAPCRRQLSPPSVSRSPRPELRSLGWADAVFLRALYPELFPIFLRKARNTIEITFIEYSMLDSL